MLHKIIFLTILLELFINGCASIEEKGKLYFTKPKKYAGVDGPQKVVDHINQNHKLLGIAFGEEKSRQFLECTLLRNQLYVAAIESHGHEINILAKQIEDAFQLDNDNFIAVCLEIKNSKIGKAFMKVQQKHWQMN